MVFLFPKVGCGLVPWVSPNPEGDSYANLRGKLGLQDSGLPSWWAFLGKVDWITGENLCDQWNHDMDSCGSRQKAGSPGIPSNAPTIRVNYCVFLTLFTGFAMYAAVRSLAIHHPEKGAWLLK